VREDLDLVRFGQGGVDKIDNSTLVLGVILSLDRLKGETFPHEGRAGVRHNEEVDTVSETVAFLEELIEELNDDSSDRKLS